MTGSAIDYFYELVNIWILNPEIGPRLCRNDNLEIPPFNLSKPVEIFYDGEGYNRGKALVLWRNSDLPGGKDQVRLL